MARHLGASRVVGSVRSTKREGAAATVIDVLPLADAVRAHERMDSRALDGRIVLAV